MTRLLILATIILSIVTYASAQIVDTLNTPIGPVTQGAKVAVTWTLLPNADAGTATGDLSATDSTTKNVVPIDPAVPLAPKSYLWNVQVPPGTYVLGLNDGSGLKQSGEVVVKAPAGGAAPAPGDAKAPAPGTPAPAPGDGKTPPPAKGAPAPGDGKTPPPAKGPAPAPSATGSTPSTPSSPSSPAGGDASSTTTPAAISTGSASSIFSGFDVVLSLLSVAIAMLQF